MEFNVNVVGGKPTVNNRIYPMDLWQKALAETPLPASIIIEDDGDLDSARIVGLVTKILEVSEDATIVEGAILDPSLLTLLEGVNPMYLTTRGYEEVNYNEDTKDLVVTDYTLENFILVMPNETTQTKS